MPRQGDILNCCAEAQMARVVEWREQNSAEGPYDLPGYCIGKPEVDWATWFRITFCPFCGMRLG